MALDAGVWTCIQHGTDPCFAMQNRVSGWAVVLVVEPGDARQVRYAAAAPGRLRAVRLWRRCGAATESGSHLARTPVRTGHALMPHALTLCASA